jgi:hypothetical protein
VPVALGVLTGFDARIFTLFEFDSRALPARCKRERALDTA